MTEGELAAGSLEGGSLFFFFFFESYFKCSFRVRNILRKKQKQNKNSWTQPLHLNGRVALFVEAQAS